MRKFIFSEKDRAENELKQIWDNSVWEQFLIFMRGQTVGIVDDEQIFYGHDIQRFCEMMQIDYPELSGE